MCVTSCASTAHSPVTTPETNDGPVPVSQINWTNGDPRETSDPYAKALFDSLVFMAAAFNADDFRGPGLRATNREDLLLEHAQTAAQTSLLMAGPYPTRIVDVDEKPDGTGATLSVCRIEDTDWMVADDSGEAETESFGFARLYSVEIRLSGSGQYQLLGSSEMFDDTGSPFCDIGDASFGYFDPVPRVESDPASPHGAIGPGGEFIDEFGHVTE